MKIGEATKDHAGWIIALDWDGGLLAMPAAMIIDTPTGFAWVDPSAYMAQPSSMRPVHFMDGAYRQTSDKAWSFVGRLTGRINRYVAGEDADIAPSLEWFATVWLPGQSLTLAQVRANAQAAILETSRFDL